MKKVFKRAARSAATSILHSSFFNLHSSFTKGLFAEWLARWRLRFSGFRILESRYVTGQKTGRAEIDIIAEKGGLLIFVEVKNRPDMEKGLDAISFKQSLRLRRAAETYIRRIRWTGPARFDAIIVSGLRIKWIKTAI
jgi:putative endonuclease